MSALSLLLLVQCATSPDSVVGSSTSLQVVMDSAVFEAIQVFQIHVLKGTTRGGSTLTCSDIPGTYRVSSADVVHVVDPAPTAPRPVNPTDPVTVKNIKVPTDEPLVFVVLGLALYKGTFVVGRGCADNQTFKAGATGASVSVDVKATTGRPCTKPSDCEPNVVCVTGPGFGDGYCAVQGCASGQTCPPGSTCISDTTLGGLCMRLCKSISDCELNYDCQGRLGLSAQGCGRVCVYPNWQKDNCCPAAACGADGGI